MQITGIDNKTVSLLDVRDGQNWRRTYENSASGRSELSEDCPEIFSEITGAGKPWRTEPAVVIPKDISVPAAESLEERVANMEQTIDTMLGGGA